MANYPLAPHQPYETKAFTLLKELIPALEAYQAKHPQKVPENLGERKPFITAARTGAALEIIKSN